MFIPCALYVPREQFLTITAADVSARPLAASAVSLALGYDDRSTQANIQHVENPRRGSYALVTQENSDAPGATGAT